MLACALPPRVGEGLLASEEAAVQGFWLPCLFYFLAASSMMLLEIWGGTVIEKYLFRWTGAEGRIKNAFFPRMLKPAFENALIHSAGGLMDTCLSSRSRAAMWMIVLITLFAFGVVAMSKPLSLKTLWISASVMAGSGRCSSTSKHVTRLNAPLLNGRRDASDASSSPLQYSCPFLTA